MNRPWSVGRSAISGRDEKEYHVGRFFCRTVERVTDLAFDRWWKSFEVGVIIQGQNHLSARLLFSWPAIFNRQLARFGTGPKFDQLEKQRLPKSAYKRPAICLASSKRMVKMSLAASLVRLTGCS